MQTSQLSTNVLGTNEMQNKSNLCRGAVSSDKLNRVANYSGISIVVITNLPSLQPTSR